ncbi:MAG: hypothetical protein NZ901_04835 [Geminocystis sp.]|nr:hypothetical protein [Geminocystis sp.]MCS7147499.1 hypothetical protein [Geminocystis sp.]MCX8077902.1 hypothetical protein [Geminocystis sp.]MDW8115192.1 hypothetical protein [Geminocystis sp.]MDW8464461.1 hypothetical protein [Geminocystis sp.]
MLAIVRRFYQGETLLAGKKMGKHWHGKMGKRLESGGGGMARR